MEATVWLLFFKYSSERGKNVYEQLTVDGLESSRSVSLVRFYEQKKHVRSFVTTTHRSLVLKEILNAEFSVLDVRFENWELSFGLYVRIFPNYS